MRNSKPGSKRSRKRLSIWSALRSSRSPCASPRRMNLFLYRRDEGGFQGWVERRLGYSRSHAYRALDVARLMQCIPGWDTFRTLLLTAIYQIAAPSTPEAARAEILGRVKAGEASLHRDR